MRLLGVDQLEISRRAQSRPRVALQQWTPLFLPSEPMIERQPYECIFVTDGRIFFPCPEPFDLPHIRVDPNRPQPAPHSPPLPVNPARAAHIHQQERPRGVKLGQVIEQRTVIDQAFQSRPPPKAISDYSRMVRAGLSQRPLRPFPAFQGKVALPICSCKGRGERNSSRIGSHLPGAEMKKRLSVRAPALTFNKTAGK